MQKMTKRNRISKAIAQKHHAQKRARERYGIELNHNRYSQIIYDIQNDNAKFIRRQSHRVSIFSIEIEGKECVVVYDRLRKTLASFLPLEAKYEDIFKGNGHVPKAKIA